MAAKRKEKLKLTSEERERLVEFSQNVWNLFDPPVPAPSLMHGKHQLLFFVVSMASPMFSDHVDCYR